DRGTADRGHHHHARPGPFHPQVRQRPDPARTPDALHRALWHPGDPTGAGDPRGTLVVGQAPTGATTAETVHLTALLLGGAPRTAVTSGHGGEHLHRRGRWGVIDIAGPR